MKANQKTAAQDAQYVDRLWTRYLEVRRTGPYYSGRSQRPYRRYSAASERFLARYGSAYESFL